MGGFGGPSLTGRSGRREASRRGRQGRGMSVQAGVARQRRAVDAARGLVALVGVLMLVVAVPAALIAWVGWPLPSKVPSVSQVTDALRDTYIPDDFLLKALAVVCWLIWVELVASL